MSGAVRYARRRCAGGQTRETGVRSGRSAAAAGRWGCTGPCPPAAAAGGSAGSYHTG